MTDSVFGERFGRLTAVREVGRNKWHDTMIECRRDCGNTVVVARGKLRSGHTRSCGCLAREMSGKRLTKHGITSGGKPRTFTIWSDMKARCLNRKAVSYPNYGGRGIGICQEWIEFKNFHEWAVSNGYADDLQLDRIDNDGDCRPENCRWVTRSQNQMNTRRSRLITLNGRTQTATEWIRELGVSRSQFYANLAKGQRYFVERYCRQP